MSWSRRRARRFAVESLEPRIVLDARFVITELMARNQASLIDDDGDSSDWVEIFNAGDMPGDLAGHFLTDEPANRRKWALPNVTLDAGEFLTIFASGKDRRDPVSPLHTNFRLDNSGGYVGLIDTDGFTAASELVYGQQVEDVSFGLGMTDTQVVSKVTPRDPTRLGSYVHLSADVGVTLAGGNVSRWLDQSEHRFLFQANHPQAVSNNPTLVEGPNGIRTVRFDGNDIIDSDLDLQLFTRGNSGLTVFVVLNPTVNGRQQFVANHAPAGAGESIEIGVDSGQVQTPGAWGIHRGSSNATSTGSNVMTPGSLQLMTTEILSSGDDGENVVFHRNGELLPTVTGGWTGAGGYSTAVDPLAIGARVDNKGQGFDLLSPDSFFRGDLAEVIIFRDEFAVEVRQGVEQFLSDKYGLGLNLDVTVSVDPQIVADQVGFFTTPTPGEINGGPRQGYVADTKFDGDPSEFHGRGYYNSAFSVNITTATRGATLVYTTNGSTPTLDNGTIVVPPDADTPPLASMTVATTTTLRAAAFKEGFEPTNVDTQTYIFVSGDGEEGVLNQPAAPAGFPLSGWGASGRPDYAVDPEVVNRSPYDVDFVDGLLQIPTISLVTDLDNLFGQSGIYSHPNNRGRSWERPVSVEIIDPTTSQTIQENAGLRIHGGVGRGGTKLSMRLYFRDEYGARRLDYPLILDADVNRFDKLVLRAQWNDGLHHPSAAANYNANSTYVRDEFSRRTFGEMGHLTATGTYAHLYLNGLYWGLYNPTERIDGDFVAEHLGGNDVDYDVLKNDASGRAQVVSGDRAVWDQVMSLSNRNLSVDANYEQLASLVDMENLADFMLQYIFIGNEDGPGKHHHMYRARKDGAKFRFLPWDTEWALGKRFNGAQRLDANRVRDNAEDTPLRLFQRLRTNTEFRLLFADRVQRHMFGDGVMTPESNIARYADMMSLLEDPIVAESARWGDFANPLSPGDPLTRDEHWDRENDWLLQVFFPQRHDIVIDQLQSARLFPAVVAPGIVPSGGRITAGTEVALIPVDGDLYFTLDGTDPRAPGDVLSPRAIFYDGQPLRIDHTTTVTARAVRDGVWSPLVDEVYVVGNIPLRLTELNYNPSAPTATELTDDPTLDNDDFEFIEIQNTGTESINLANFRFANGILFTFPSSELAPGERGVIVKDQLAFESRYGANNNIIGQFDGGRLDNAGERLTLVDAIGQTIVDVSYGDRDPWPARADGAGATLELADPENTPTDRLGKSYAWRGSTEFGGSPGRAGTEPVGVVINEIVARTGAPVTRSDSIELLNTTDRVINVGGWFLSDSEVNPLKYEIPANTLLGPGEFAVFDESHFNPTPLTPDPLDFALNGAGDDVWLVIPNGTGGVESFVDDVHFGASADAESFGRTPNATGRLAPMTENSFGAANSAPRVGPIIISEINYNPGLPSPAALAIDPSLTGDDLEFVEIHNPTNMAVVLTDWRLRGGVDYDFAEDTMLGGGETLLVVPFNPTNPDNAGRLTAFWEHYGMNDGTNDKVRLVGGLGNRLSNSGERVQLQRPDEGPIGLPNVNPRLWEDEVLYDDLPPWPMADGTGLSLARTSATSFGNSATSWRAQPPSPGTFFSTVGDFNGDEVVDVQDVDLLAAGIRIADPQFDVNHDDQVDQLDLFFMIHAVLGTHFGDANLDGRFDSSDLVQVFRSGEYEDGVVGNSTWAAGDWNGDGEFGTRDLVIAFQDGGYTAAATRNIIRAPINPTNLVAFWRDSVETFRKKGLVPRALREVARRNA